ncbi:MAG: cell division protein FtsZ [Alphaproteobacteria bacterium]|nr:cell division protein FtsZ [Alphaproteobacteria bacterium]
MSINLSLPTKEAELKPRITVVGIGGAGGNAINNMIRSGLQGVEFVASNTDSQALAHSEAPRQIQLGATITQGLGAGSRPDIGRAAAEEAIDELIEHLNGTHMAFITAGMGGGTGTGAAPVIARAARELGILTVGVVTKPFDFEGGTRMHTADGGIEELQQYVDTLIIIPNQNLFRVANEKTTFAEAFNMADEVLHCGVRGVTDLMVKPGLINLDFADIRSVMTEMGKAQMGTGEAEGEKRALEAAEAAISNPLLQDSSMKGARGVLINITGGLDMTMFEVDEAANRIKEEVDPKANIIFGTAIEDTMEGLMRVSVVATGIDAAAAVGGDNVHLLTDHPRVDNVPEMPAIGDKYKPMRGAEPVTAEEPRGGVLPLHGGPGGPGLAPQAAQTTETAEATAAPDNGLDISPPPGRADKAGVLNEAMAEADSVTSEPASTPAWLARNKPPFISPRPIEASGEAQGGAEEATANPFAAAAMANGGSEKKEPGEGRVSMFRKLTGSRNKVKEVKAAEPAEPVQTAEPAQPAPSIAPAPAPAAEAVADSNPPNPQPRLGGMDPVDRTPAAQSDDDLLEIPAFLRRQAN